MGKEYQVIKQAGEEVLRIDATTWGYLPFVDSNPVVMGYLITTLAEVPSVSRVVFNQRKNYEYSLKQTHFLIEIALIFNHFIKEKNLFQTLTDPQEQAHVQHLIYNLLRYDPLGSFVEAKRLIREAKTFGKTSTPYLEMLTYIYDSLSATAFITHIKTRLEGYRLGDRSIYADFFKPNITPDFINSRYMSKLPLHADQIDAYTVAGNTVKIFKNHDSISYLYHVSPPEFNLSEDHY